MRVYSIFIILACIITTSLANSASLNPVNEIATISGDICASGLSVACTDLSSSPNILADGYYTQSDGWGGYFFNIGSCTTANGGSIISDLHGVCFQRQAFPTNVRQWGARCDIQSFDSSLQAIWDTADNAIAIPSTKFPNVGQPKPTQYIAATQIGPAGSATPQWADRWSTLITPGTHYYAGDLLSFKGQTSSGTFTQQLSIVVDQVGTSAANANQSSSGQILKWRFVTGGQYTSLPDGGSGPGLIEDTTFSCHHPYTSSGGCATTGYDSSAVMSPAWSGWSVLDHGTQPPSAIENPGSVVAGAIISLGLAGYSPNQGHNPKIIVMSTTASDGVSLGGIASWQWLDYGSYNMVPAPLGTPYLAQIGCVSNCVQIAPEWTRGTLSTKIVAAVGGAGYGTCPSRTTYTCIFVHDIPSNVRDFQQIEALYYGTDDGAKFTNVLAHFAYQSNLHVTGYCGTTTALILPGNGNSVTPSNFALVGDAYKTSGVFAFADSAIPLMNHVIYAPSANLTFGGGMRDLEVEGLGIPQGTGYFYWNKTTAPPSPYYPAGYNGPAPASPFCSMPPTGVAPYYCVSSSGSIVEIDSAKEAIFNNLAVYDAYGEGNAEFQAGVADGDPMSVLNSDFGSVFLNSDRFAVAVGAQAGALDPEYSVNFQSAHDSQYTSLVAFDGTEADVYQPQGNIYSGLHVESDVLSGAHGQNAPSRIMWPANISPLAGVALYGLESPKNVLLSNMQCDTVWTACVFIGSQGPSGTDSPSVISNIAQKCSGFANVWPTYLGVEVASGASGAAIMNVAAHPSCGIPATQLIVYDNPEPDAAVNAPQLCVPPQGYQATRYYTGPFTPSGPTTGLTVTSGRLYAIPLQIQCRTTVSELSTYVESYTGSPSCELGIYQNNGSGQPGALIIDAGSVALSTAGSSAFISTVPPVPPSPQPLLPTPQLAPGLVFLVIDCNGTPTLETGLTTEPLAGNLLGLATQTSTNAVLYGNWTFGPLPQTFPNVHYAANVAPLVFFRP